MIFFFYQYFYELDDYPLYLIKERESHEYLKNSSPRWEGVCGRKGEGASIERLFLQSAISFQ